MKNKFLAKSVGVICASFLWFPIIGYSGDVGTNSRMIRNETNKVWIIVNQPCTYAGEIMFDSSPNRGAAVCAEGSILTNGPCMLPPGQVTFVKYNWSCGRLVFTDSFKSILVDYSSMRDGVSMKSSRAAMINDDHGDLTIIDR